MEKERQSIIAGNTDAEILDNIVEHHLPPNTSANLVNEIKVKLIALVGALHIPDGSEALYARTFEYHYFKAWDGVDAAFMDKLIYNVDVFISMLETCVSQATTTLDDGEKKLYNILYDITVDLLKEFYMRIPVLTLDKLKEQRSEFINERDRLRRS